MRVLTEIGVPDETAGRVAELVRATAHDGSPSTTDARVLVDIDLSILGDPPDVFAEYEKQIRREYSWVPMPMYRPARVRILRAFLERENVYCTPAFRDRLEEQARVNLARSIESL